MTHRKISENAFHDLLHNSQKIIVAKKRSRIWSSDEIQNENIEKPPLKKESLKNQNIIKEEISMLDDSLKSDSDETEKSK